MAVYRVRRPLPVLATDVKVLTSHGNLTHYRGQASKPAPLSKSTVKEGLLP